MRMLIHGDNLVQSRIYLNKSIDSLRESTPDIIRLEGKKTTLTQLIQATESSSLFSQDKLIVVENLYKHSSKNVQKNLITQLSADYPDNLHLIVWEQKRLTPSQIKKFKNFDVKEFKTSAVVFKFLDCLTPNQTHQNLNFYKKAVNQDSTEFIFYMLTNRVRDLITIDKNQRLAPWQKSRLKSQKAKFTQNNLLELHAQLFELDWKMKTGQTILNMKKELEIILVSI